jgi:hypothetical protein
VSAGYRSIDAVGGGGSDISELLLPGGVFAEATRYFRGPGGPLGANAPANETGVCHPIAISAPMTLDRIAVNVTLAGEAGSVARLGIYGPVPPSRSLIGGATPLLLDAGTVDTATTGFKELTISEAVTPGWYLLVVVPQNAPTTQPTFSAFTTSSHGVVASIVTAAPTATYAGYQQVSYASGALPASPPRNGGQATNVPVVFLRAS